jgi:tRNA nucleotidyltransferase/poly(A) polymerase
MLNSLDPTKPIAAGRVLTWPPIIEVLRDLIAAQRPRRLNGPIYLVGGVVRDAYLGRAARDIDLATPGDGQPIARTIANALDGAYYPLDSERGVGRALIDYEGEHYTLDVSRFRGESLLDDLTARDFTLNALAVRLDGDGDLNAIYDPTGGLADLHQKRLRRCSPDSIPSDPIRSLRAVRQSVDLKFMIAPDTRADLHTARLDTITPERIRDEFFRLLDGAQPHAALRALDSLGLLAQIVPEVATMRGVAQSPPHVYDVWEHTLKVVENLDRVLAVISPRRTDATAADAMLGMVVFKLDRHRKHLQSHLAKNWPSGRTARALLMFTTLLHDSGKPPTLQVVDGHNRFPRHDEVGGDLVRERAAALRLSNDEIERAALVVRGHMQPGYLYWGNMTATMAAPEPTQVTVPPRAIHRFWRTYRKAGIDVCLVALADFLSVTRAEWELRTWLGYLAIVDTLLDAYFNQRHTLIAPTPLLDGNQLMQALDLQPGPTIGYLLPQLLEAQAVGEITTRTEAVELARRLLPATPGENHAE